MTPREFQAHAALLDRSERTTARLLAAIHNGPMVRKDEQLWVSDMFMPGYQEPAPSVESQTLQYRTLKGALGNRKRKTPLELTAERQIAHRRKRMQEAAAQGKSGKELEAIMRGVA